MAGSATAILPLPRSSPAHFPEWLGGRGETRRLRVAEGISGKVAAGAPLAHQQTAASNEIEIMKTRIMKNLNHYRTLAAAIRQTDDNAATQRFAETRGGFLFFSFLRVPLRLCVKDPISPCAFLPEISHWLMVGKISPRTG